MEFKIGNLVVYNSDANPALAGAEATSPVPATPLVPRTPQTPMSEDEDGAAELRVQQEALAKEQKALESSAKSLSAHKMAEARQKMAEAQAKINQALKTRNDEKTVNQIVDQAMETAAETRATIEQQSKTHNHVSTSTDGVFAIPIVAIVFTFGYLSIKAIVNAFAGRGANRQSARLSAEERALVEKLQRTITQMESRIESLETILVETRRSTQSQSYGTKF